MKPIILIGGSLLGLGILAMLATTENDESKPVVPDKTDDFARVAALPFGVDYEKYLDGEFNGWLWVSQKQEWARRAATLQVPPITDKNDIRYTELYYSGPWVYVLAPEADAMAEGNIKIQGKPVVQRNWYGSNPKSEGGGIDVLGLVGMVGNYTLPYIPGYGTAANAALQGAVALGRGESLDNAALAAARGALPPYGQVAFDMAVGVASGKQVDKAALDAGLNWLEQKYPGAKTVYAKGYKLSKDVGL